MQTKYKDYVNEGENKLSHKTLKYNITILTWFMNLTETYSIM